MNNTRRSIVFIIFLGMLLSLIARLVYLSVFEKDFLRHQSASRVLRVQAINAHRGIIEDRVGRPLAISTLVSSVWMNGLQFSAEKDQIKSLAVLLHYTAPYLNKKIYKAKNKHFFYLKRHVAPQIAKHIMDLAIPGVFLQKEYQRYYPDGRVHAQVLGRTDVDDKGQEGLELAYDAWLRGTPGKKMVLQGAGGHILSDVAQLKPAERGHNLSITLDHRIQYLAFQAVEKAVNQYSAKSGTAVVLSVKTGEILAMVNTPAYNPNRRTENNLEVVRNKAVTDLFEPGSTMKPFAIAMALESGLFSTKSQVDTGKGHMLLGGYVIEDEGRFHGKLTLAQILQKSSNIGVAKIMLALQPAHYRDLLVRLGFGNITGSTFPGESAGLLPDIMYWNESVLASMAYGYGIGVTTLQLAHAYAIIANEGFSVPVTFLKLSASPKSVPVIPQSVANKVMHLLEGVVSSKGTGRRAQIKGYAIAGKTGTAYIASGRGYDKKRYIASFVGVAPVHKPEFVVVVVVREPQKAHLGALVAAPAFAEIMEGTLRTFNIPPDAF